MPDVHGGPSAASAGGPLRRRTFLAAADKSPLDSPNTRRPPYPRGSDFGNGLANSRALGLARVDRTSAGPAGG
jgi:hypothetical protein